MARSEPKSVYELPEFKALQAEWYQKLKDDGFVDIEAPGVDPLTEDDDRPFRIFDFMRESDRHHVASDRGTAEFYTIAEQWLDRGRWRSRRERWFFNEWAHGAELKAIRDRHPIESPITYDWMVKTFRALREEMLMVTKAEELPDDPEEWL